MIDVLAIFCDSMSAFFLRSLLLLQLLGVKLSRLFRDLLEWAIAHVSKASGAYLLSTAQNITFMCAKALNSPVVYYTYVPSKEFVANLPRVWGTVPVGGKKNQLLER